jgi:hypothetical protein
MLSVKELTQKYPNRFNTDYTALVSCKGSWLFREGSGTSVDDTSSASHNGTFASSGHPAWSSTVPHSSYFYSANFDGSTSDYITVADFDMSFTEATGNFTMVWSLYADTTADYNQIIGSSDAGWIFHTTSNGSVYCGHTAERFTPTELGTGTVSTGAWNRFAVSCGGQVPGVSYAGAVFYKNGSSIATKQINIGTSWTNFTMGSVSSTNTIDGLLAGVAVFAEILDSTQINEIYTSGLKPRATSGFNIGVSQKGGWNIGASQVDSTSVNISITAALLSLASSISTPTVSTTGSINFSASVLSLLASIYSPTITSSVALSIANLSLLTTVLEPTVSTTGNINFNAEVLTITSSITTSTITTTGNISFSASLLSLTSSIFTSTIFTGVNVNASIITMTSSILDSTILAVRNINYTPSTIFGNFSLIDPTVQAIRNVSYSSEVLSLISNIYAPSAFSGVNIEASAFSLIASILSPTITAGTSIDTSVSRVLLALSILEPTIYTKLDNTEFPSTLALALSILAPTVVIPVLDIPIIRNIQIKEKIDMKVRFKEYNEVSVKMRG